jgi:ABC-type uncharacterized transport system substrate-binding protein
VSRRLAVALLSLAWPAAWAGAAEVALVRSGEVASWRAAADALRAGLSEHTLVELDLGQDPAEARSLASGLRGKQSVIVAFGALAAQAVHESLPEVPLVVCMVPDPARLGLQAAPGLSGVAFQPPVKNQLAAFRMVNPRAVRIGIVYNEANAGHFVREALAAAPVVRLAIVAKAAASDKEVPQALRSLLRGPDAVDAIWVPPDPLLLSDQARRFLLAETLKAGRPVYSFSPSLVPEGALVSNGASMVSTGELAAELVVRLAGAERSTRIEYLVPRSELVINKKIADRLKIEIPASALSSAAKVY